MKIFAQRKGFRSSLKFAIGTLIAVSVVSSRAPNALAQDLSPSSIPEAEKGNSKSAQSNEAAEKRVPQQPIVVYSNEKELGLQTIRNILRDQREIWTSPARIRLGHADWLVPFAGLAAGFLVTDRDANLHLSNSPSALRRYQHLSNYGIAGMAGAVGGVYLWGKVTNDAHKQEAGILSGEAAVNALLVSEALKFATGRERPIVDFSRGKFWQGGDSFPSDHTAAAWAVASVLTHEYPGLFTKILAYGAASAISISGVQGKRHFPADVFVGSGIGWLSGWQVYRAHHNPELGGGTGKSLGLTQN